MTTARMLLHLPRLFLIALICTAHAHEPASRTDELTADDFDARTSGRLAFLRFYSPHCPHCQSMAGAWDKLTAHYRGLSEHERSDVLIGSVDCTDANSGEALCRRFKIVGLPTLLGGDASLGGVYLEEYRGEKSFRDLKKFAAALAPRCNPGRLDACTPAERRLVEEFAAMSYGELEGFIAGKEQEMQKLRAAFKDAKAVMQRSYDEKLLEKELFVTKARAKVKLIKEIVATKA